jgi:hypothetical protein
LILNVFFITTLAHYFAYESNYLSLNYLQSSKFRLGISLYLNSGCTIKPLKRGCRNLVIELRIFMSCVNASTPHSNLPNNDKFNTKGE